MSSLLFAAVSSPLRGVRPAGWCRDVRPAAHSLSFASPKESKQRKGDPTAPAPAGLLCAAQPSREVQKLALRAQTSELLHPAEPALLDGAHGAHEDNARGELVWLRQTSLSSVLADRSTSMGPAGVFANTWCGRRAQTYVQETGCCCTNDCLNKYPFGLSLSKPLHAALRQAQGERVSVRTPAVAQGLGHVQRATVTAEANAKRSEPIAGVAIAIGPRVRRRAAQGWAEKETQMFEPVGRVSAFPAQPEQRRAAPQGPAQSGRLSFGSFSLAKQRKGTRLSGRNPDAASRSQQNQKKATIETICEGGHP